MVEKESEKAPSYYETIRDIIKSGQPLPESLVNRQPHGVSIFPGPNKPDHPPGTSLMEGGVPLKKE